MKKRTLPFRGLLGVLLPLAIFLAVLLFFFAAVNELQGDTQAENRRQLEETLRKNCAACYAVEGAYPPSIDYLKDYYGVQIDEERYTVCYNVYAENLMPDITVLENP